MSSIAAFALLVATLPLAALAPGGTFTDDDGSVHEGGIEAIAAEQITVGCNPPFGDLFCPDRLITRAEMATMIARALSLPATGTDHFDDDDGHVLEGAINRIAQAGITVGCNPPTNNNFCPDRILTRAEMATMLTRALELTAMKPPPRPPLDWELVVDGLAGPIQALVPPGETRILIAQLDGVIRVFENGALRDEPFLDISSSVLAGGERGLLSIAIHPDYPADRRLFAWYSAPGGSGDHTTHLVEFDIAPDLQTASSPRTVLSVVQPFSNHNGGFVGFGPDGYLYLGLGDGGSGNDPGARARNLNTLLGKMIRIDVDGAPPYQVPADNPYVGAPGRDEIWASGLRNPWRWSMDGGNLYIGDVGQGTREEVNAVALAPVGYDFGWSRYEGSVCNPNDTDPSCSTTGLTMPVAEYGRSVGRTITGGVVYRGPTVRSLDQYYVYADFGSGVVRAFRLLDGQAVEAKDLSGALREPGLVSFGFDANGEILAVSLADGAVYRLVGG